MKIKMFRKEFPLVALVLVVVGLSSGILAFNYTSMAVTVINSDEALRFSWDEEPHVLVMTEYPAGRTPDGYEFDYYFRAIPGPTSLAPFNQIEKTKEIPESVVYGETRKSEDWVGFVKVGDAYYKYDMDKTLKEMEGGVDYREVKQGRTPWLLSYYGPKILGSLALAVVSLSIAAALLASYKKGYITKRNVLLVKLSSAAIGIALVSFFVAKGLLIIGVFGTYESGIPWPDLLVGSILPSLFILAAVIGLTHIVCQNMRSTINMKEEIDATV
ncbi:MAG TPA: hypothetical protein PKB15_08425 [Acidimicrobiia bacterium]|nr:hypothetical protein [Acidimicrobiia bacterium]